ncbi:MAG TPA: SDR family NAD(P)-dependent oxidoreductase [Candidatus Nanopelagicaceae bacterium]|nr:SDR family NAD(P)-dependent oxidoreductase [Candidatus Nanopelagicaceae bacterium]
MAGLIVVCGAAGALGQAVVAEFARLRLDVVAVVRHQPDPNLVPDPSTTRHPLHRLGADLSDPTDVDRLWAEIDELGQVAALVNLVGGFAAGAVTATDVVTYRSLIELNLSTTWWVCRAAASRLSKEGEGAIVNVAARTALHGGAGSAAYAVAKAGVLKLTEVLAAELAPAHVRVNAVLPAVIDTTANRASMGKAGLAGAVPPDAIAKVISFLVSDQAWPISGAAIPVYGWG